LRVKMFELEAIGCMKMFGFVKLCGLGNYLPLGREEAREWPVKVENNLVSVLKEGIVHLKISFNY